MQTYVSIVVIAKSAGTWYYDSLNVYFKEQRVRRL